MSSFIFYRVRLRGRSLSLNSVRSVAPTELYALVGTAEKTPAILKQLAQAHGAKAGVYAAVLVESTIRKGDPVKLI